MLKISIGIILIIVSFIYIIINHDKSLMDKLMEKRNLKWHDDNIEEKKENKKHRQDKIM